VAELKRGRADRATPAQVINYSALSRASIRRLSR
jgi:hypothetical protein